MKNAVAVDTDRMSIHTELFQRQALRQLISCQECERPWVDPAERWRIYLTDDEPRVPVAYCRECAAREFDPD